MANENIVYRVVNKKSSVSGKIPTPEQLLYGEIAINYAASSETISIKNSNNEVVTFPSSRVTNEINEEIDGIKSDVSEIETTTARVLNDLNNRLTETQKDVSDIDLVSARAFNDLNNRLTETQKDVSDIDLVSARGFNDLNEKVSLILSEIESLKERITRLGG